VAAQIQIEVALEPDDLNETDEAILDELVEGRVTPQYIANQLDISRPYASEKLKRFVEHGHVEKLASGLYELEDDPRNGEHI
jgi:predicted transcriptional regulator